MPAEDGRGEVEELFSFYRFPFFAYSEFFLRAAPMVRCNA